MELDLIEMTRGDTCPLRFKRLAADGEVITTIADEVYFTVKKSFANKTPILQKTLSDMTFDEAGVYHFVINPDDTDKLAFADYYWDVEVIVSTYKQTISKGILRVTDEATWVSNEV